MNTPTTFKLNGKKISSLYLATNTAHKESIESILSENTKASKVNSINFNSKLDKSKQSLLTSKTSKYLHNLISTLLIKIRFLVAFITIIKLKRTLFAITYNIQTSKNIFTKKWVFYSVIIYFLFGVSVITFPGKINPNIQDKYSIFLSRPLVLGKSNYRLYSKDSRAHRINEVLKEYNCPLEGLGEVFVSEADKNNIPWRIVAAISFQESGCGKLTPVKEGVESNNAWGWAVYGDNVHIFDNWVRGIETVSKYLSDRFYSQGISEPCEIMKIYTPPSKGSWCEGVKYFGDKILNYKSPEI